MKDCDELEVDELKMMSISWGVTWVDSINKSSSPTDNWNLKRFGEINAAGRLRRHGTLDNVKKDMVMVAAPEKKQVEERDGGRWYAEP